MVINRKGITLIALVISIVVMLILAGVTVATLTGDNGLLTKAGEARNTNIEAEGLERLQLAVMASRDDRGINTSSLAKHLSEISDLTDTNNNEITASTEITLPKSLKLNDIKYVLYEDGNVEKIIEGKLPSRYQQVEYIESTGTQWIDTKLLAGNYIDLSVKIEGNYTYIPNTYEFIFGANANSGPWVFIGYFKSRNSFLVQCR